MMKWASSEAFVVATTCYTTQRKAEPNTPHTQTKNTHCSSCCCCYCLITRMAPLTVLEFISIAFHTEGGALWCFYLLIARAHNGSCTHPHHTHTHAYMDKHRHTLVFASAEYRNRFWWNTLQHTQLPAHTHSHIRNDTLDIHILEQHVHAHPHTNEHKVENTRTQHCFLQFFCFRTQNLHFATRWGEGGVCHLLY